MSMEIWYRTRRYSDAIEPVNVVKSTEKTVTVSETDYHGYVSQSRHAILSGYSRHFRTWDAAHAYLLKRAGDSVTTCRMHLERANGAYGNVKGMKRPQEQAAPAGGGQITPAPEIG